jgi:cytochrome P450
MLWQPRPTPNCSAQDKRRALHARKYNAAMVVDTLIPLPRVATLDIGHGDDTLAQLSALFAQHGDAFRIHSPAMQRDLLVLSHPDHVRHVLVDHAGNYVKGLGIERVAILLGKGLMTSEGTLWRSQRRALQPAFHRTSVARHLSTIIDANSRLVARWSEAAAASTTVDVTHDISALTLEIVLRAIFSDDYDRLVAEDSAFALLTAESERDLRFAYAFRQLGQRLLREIARRRAESPARDDILQTLVDARDRASGAAMPDRQVQDEVLTLIVAGHETTASALQWFWYRVAREPGLATALHAEANAMPLDFATSDRYPLARAALAETMRLYPPGWMLTRRALAAVQVGNVAIDAGDDILVSPYLVHRHPLFWPHPERFDVQRFAAGVATPSRFAYLPFGLGPRACIGEPLALLEMLVHVVVVARALDLRADDDADVRAVAKVNLRPDRAIALRPVRHAST